MLFGSSDHGCLKEKIWRPFTKLPARSCAVFLFFIFLLIGALVTSRVLDYNAVFGGGPRIPNDIPEKELKRIEVPINCTAFDLRGTCPTIYPTNFIEGNDRQSPTTCPEYFRWIHEDLRPWSRTGISRDMVERAKTTAHFRLIVMNGKAYAERYHRAYQTRDIFTLWGILQLLRRYPGKVPDLELMFDLEDRPYIKSRDFSGPKASSPPALFKYCKDDESLDIVFPDWSFWGWPEVNIRPWEPLLKDFKKVNSKTDWMARKPYAYWRGNPDVSPSRHDLMKCNVSPKKDWKARLYRQDWNQEAKHGFKQSNLMKQCTHRYKIYIEGIAWSVSQKYILSCDSLTLQVKPHYYDFFARGLVPLLHYWPIKEDDKCRSIKFAVDWGNNNTKQAQEMGKAGSEFMQNELKMDYVYDYMFHLLNEYAKLMSFKPVITENTRELCSEELACHAEGILEKKFLIDSFVKDPADRSPCTMVHSYDPSYLREHLKRKEDTIRKVELWENEYWDKQGKKKEP